MDELEYIEKCKCIMEYAIKRDPLFIQHGGFEQFKLVSQDMVFDCQIEYVTKDQLCYIHTRMFSITHITINGTSSISNTYSYCGKMKNQPNNDEYDSLQAAFDYVNSIKITEDLFEF